jgi:protein required for attachment to host cells
MTTSKIWILIADGARARLLSAEGRRKALHVVEKLELQADHRSAHELGHDRPTRVYEAHGSARHAVEPKSDPHRELKRDFAEQIAVVLDENLKSGNFDKLVVAAAPVTLGDLRKAMSAAVKDSVVAEVAMDLTKVPNSDVPQHIEDVIPL